MKKIAFFDFDGTITTKDTFPELIRYMKGDLSFFTGCLLLSPWLAAMKLKLISNTAAKQKVMRYFYGTLPVETFRRICDDFSRERLPSLIRPAAFRQINDYREDNTPVVIVSASPEYVLEPWCKKNGLAMIATRLEEKEGRITGNIYGQNCHSQEKVRRIRQEYDIGCYTEIHAYGDSPGDRPMLALATHAHYRPFREK